jgi:hypothetical protein
MRFRRWAICAWPGLADTWQRGDLAALLLAIGFALLLNLVMLTTFVWTEMVSQPIALTAWTVVLGLWGASFVSSVRSVRAAAAAAAGAEDLFPAILGEYLKGNWLEAERLCRQSLRSDEHDVDAQLMLATIGRRTRRFDEAERVLDKLAHTPGSAKWGFEIRDELECIRHARQTAVAPAPEGHKAAGLREAA